MIQPSLLALCLNLTLAPPGQPAPQDLPPFDLVGGNSPPICTQCGKPYYSAECLCGPNRGQDAFDFLPHPAYMYQPFQRHWTHPIPYR